MANQHSGHSGFLTWKEYIAHLEQVASDTDNPSEQSEIHYQIAQLWVEKYMQRARALVHYQKAFQCDPGNVAALRKSINMYWEMGRVEPIVKVVGILNQLQSDPPQQVSAFHQLLVAQLVAGDVVGLGQTVSALTALVPDDSFAAQVAEDLVVLEQGVIPDPPTRATNDPVVALRYLFVASIAGTSAEAVAPFVNSLALAHPLDVPLWIMCERLMGEVGGSDEILVLQQMAAEQLDGQARAKFLAGAAGRWLALEPDGERAAKLLLQACELDAGLPGAFGFLYNHYVEQGHSETIEDLLAHLRLPEDESILQDILESAVILYWRVTKSSVQAEFYYKKLAALAPQSEVAKQYFEECKMTNNSGTDNNDQVQENGDVLEQQAAIESSDSSASVTENSATLAADEVNFEPDGTVSPELDAAVKAAMAAEDNGPDAGIKAWQQAWNTDPGHPVVVEALERLYGETGKWSGLADFLKRMGRKVVDDNKFILTHMTLARIYREHLDQIAMAANTYGAIVKKYDKYLPAIEAGAEAYEQMERWPDLVKMLKAKGELLTDSAERIDLWLRVANLFLNQFSNQAEAIKAFEKVLEVDPAYPEAVDFLKEAYEKRRDYKKLIAMMQVQADAADDMDRLALRVEIAQMASEKIKKPDVCIEYWEAVLAEDEDHEQALSELSNFYERAKDWQKLTGVLEKVALNTADASKQKAVYQKLGMVYGDKVGDDEKAIVAWKALLEIEPEDRRAQEQLKKRFLAIQDWTSLEEFYAESGKWDEFIRVLEREAGNDKLEVSARVGLLFKIADLYINRKERVDKAAAAYEKVLDIDSTNLDAAEALIPMYEESGKTPEKLARALEVKLGHLEDDAEKVEMMQRIGRLLEERVGDEGRAFELFLSAFELNPLLDETSADLERTAGAAGKWEEVVAAYKNQYENAVGDAQVDYRIAMARVINEELGRAEEALDHFNAILADDPKNAKAIHALERIYAQMGRFEELLDIYARRIEMAEDDEERKEIYYNQALLWEEEIDDSAKAIAVYNQIIEMAGDEQRSLAALDRLYSRDEKWEEVSSVIERELALGLDEVDDEIELKYRHGFVLMTHLGQGTTAVDDFREVLALSPGHEGAVSALEQLLGADDAKGAAASLLVPYYEENEHWEKYIAAAQILVDTSDDQVEQFDLLMRIGAVCAQYLDSSERAFVAYSRAFKINPDDPIALEQLEGMTTVLDAWAELVELLEAGARATGDTENAKTLWLKAAQIYDTQLEKVEPAINAYRAVIEIDRQCEEAVVALEEIFGREERFGDLVEILGVKVESVSDNDDKIEIYKHMARIQEEMLEQPESAVVSMREILNIDPTNLEALRIVDRLLVRLEKYTDLADNLQQQLGIEGDVDRMVSLKLRLAAIQENQLDAMSAAIDIYREVFELEPDNQEAIAALERIVSIDEFKSEVAQILEPLYREMGQWEKLVGVIEIMIAEEEDDDRKVELLHEIANLYETAGDEPQKAFATLGQALRVDMGSERTVEDLERLSRVLDLYEELVGLYSELVEKVEDDDLAARFHLRIAQICEEQLQATERAIGHYQKVLEIDPMHLEAATALERAFQITENYEALATIYQRKVEMVPDLEEQKDLLFKAAQIYEDVLENTDKAIEVYLRILDVDADELRAISQLEGLYLRLERWDDLQGIYNQKVDLVHDPDEKKEVLYVLGAMYERELKDNARAITTYQRILEFDPDDFQAISRLDILYTEAKEWPDLLSVLEREIELVDDPDEAVSYKFRVAELYVRHLDDVARAIDYLKDILTISPNHEPTISLLEELLNGEAEPLMAAEVLEPLYQDLAAWRKMIELIEVKLSHCDDEWQKVELFHQAAEILQSDLHLDAPKEAFDMYARALAVDHINEKTLAQLDELANQTDRWTDYAKLLDGLIEDSDDDAEVSLLALKAAEIYELHLDDADAAIVRNQRVIAVDEDNKQAILQLDKLYQIAERWTELAELLPKESRVMEDPEEALDVQFRLGRLFQQELEQTERAVETYREILAADPSHEGAISALEGIFGEGQLRGEILEVLEPLLQMQNEWGKLVALYIAQLEGISEVADRLEMIHQIAETYEDKLLDPVEAFKWCGKALAEDAFDDKAGSDVERLASATEMYSELAELYEQLFVHYEDVEAKKLVAKRAARVAEEELQDVARAERAFRGCLELGEDDLEVLVALDRIYTQYMEWDRLVGILEILARVEPGETEQVEYLYRMGDVLESQLDDEEKARLAFTRIVDDLDPGHRAALGRLEMIYANREDWKSLHDVYAKMRESAENGADEADLLAKMAHICADCLGDIKGAIDMWEGVLDILGEDVQALESLADLYSREENWSELVEILERAVNIADDDAARIRIYSQLGMVWGECLDRDRNALENWQNVLSIDLENIPALQAIAKIYDANQEWDELIETLERIIEVGAGVFEIDELKRYYFRLASILADVVERPFDAIDVWRQVFDVDPSDIKIPTALERLYREQEMWTELATVLGRKATLLEGEAQIETWLEQAAILEEHLATPQEAREPYLNILQASPLHDHAFARCVEIMTEQEAWDDLIAVYSRRLEVVAEPDVQISLLHQAAVIYEEKLDQGDNAFLVMQRAFEIDYANDDTGKHLERLASATGRWQELFGACNQILATAQDVKTQIDLCLRIGKWYAAIGNPEYAIQYYQQVLALDNSHGPSLRAMGDLYREAKQWGEFVEVLRRAVDCEEDPEVKKNILVELGEVYLEYLQDLPEARKVYKEALEIDPTLEKALVALERMFKATENWEELIPVLRRKIDVLDENEVDAIISTHLKIADIYENNLSELAAATDELKANLELDSSHLPTLRGLKRLYEKQERWQDLVDIMEAELDYVQSENDRIGLLTHIASLLETKFRKPEQAIERLEEVIAIDATDSDALTGLERLYRNTGKWEELVETFEKHVDATVERDARVPILEEMGRVLFTEIKDIDRAMDCYQQVLDVQPAHLGALDNLAKLQVKAEDWGAAHETLKRLAETVEEPAQKVDLYVRLGELNEQHLMDRGAAVEHFRSALDIEPGCIAALAALKAIHLDEGEWLAACEMLEAQQEFTDNPRHKSKLQFELGDIYSNKLQDDENANIWFARALESDSDNQDAALPLSAVYFETEQWDKAAPLLDMLVRLAGKRSAEEQILLLTKQGKVADQQGNLEKALKAYQRAYDLNTQNLESLLNLADALYRSETWDQAFKLYQMILVHHRDERSADEIVDIFFRLGSIKAALKERRKALNMFDKALEIDGGHVPTLEAVVALQEEQKNYEQVIHFKKILIDSVDDVDRQFQLWDEIGDIWQQKLKNPQKAISAYQEASNIDPNNRPILHKLMPLYQATKQWQNVVDTISRVCEMEEDQSKLARLYYTMAVIFRDEIKSAEDAVKNFNLALDNDTEGFKNLKAFEAIDRILTQQKNWKQLERNYRKMIHRITGKGHHDLETSLWHFLGEIYRTRMGQFEAAAEAFKMAAQLDPGNVTRHEILAELYTKMPGRLDDAVAEHQALIAENPYRVDSYKALRRLYFEHRQYDKAWCLCATMAFLKKADQEEQQFFEQYRVRGTVRAQARLDNNAWIKDLFHPDESVYMGKIFELVTNAVRSYKIQPIKNFGLKKNQKRPHNDTLTFSKTFYYAAQVINLPMIPDLYIQDDQSGGLRFALTEPVASASGTDLLSGFSPQDLLFLVTRHLSYYRPEHYIRWIMPSHRELKALMLAAIKLGNPSAQIPDDPGLMELQANLSKAMEPVQIDMLRKVVTKFLKSGEQADLKKWIRSAELTACRAGFLLCNDLDTAARMIQADNVGIDDMSAKEKIKELVMFSVSESYFRLRETLGIVIGA